MRAFGNSQTTFTCALTWITGRRVAPSLFLIICLLSTIPCRAVIVSTDPGSTNTIGVNTIAPAGLPEWNNVGLINGGTGVYIGNGWMLTAEHVGQGNFTVASNTYSFTQGVRVTDSLGNPTDLLLLHLSSVPAGLSEISLATSSPTVGTAYYNVGYGYERDTAIQYYDASWNPVSDPSDATYAGFGYGSSRADKTWGTNTVYNFGTPIAPVATTTYDIGFGNVTAFAGEFVDGTDQIVSGDSGGAAFNAAGQLIGINDAIGTQTGQPANTAIYGDGSYMVDVATYEAEIQSITGVPEPGSIALAAVAMLALTRRPRLH